MKYQTNINDKSAFMAQVADHEEQDEILDAQVDKVSNSPKTKRNLAAAIADKRRKHKLHERKAIDEFDEAVNPDGSIDNEEDRHKQIDAVENETKATAMLGDLAVKLGQLDSNFISDKVKEQLKDMALEAQDGAKDIRDSMRASKVSEYTPIKSEHIPINEIVNMQNGRRSDIGESYINKVQARQKIAEASKYLGGR